MTPHDEFFQEGQLDDQLDDLAETADQPPNTLTSRIYCGLSRFYAFEAAQETQSLAHVRQRLADYAAAPVTSQAPHRARKLPVRLSRHPRRPSRLRRFMCGAVAVLVVGALVGGFAAVLHVGSGTPAFTNYHWQIVASPNTPLAVNALTGITVRTSTDAWAWGTTNVAPTNTNSNPITIPLVEHWDGHQWRIVATPRPPEGGQLADIVAIAPDDAWAVGQQLTGGAENTSNAPLVEHWDGHRWTIQPDWVVNGGLSALAALAADNIWAVGNGEQAGLIQHWDGRSWQTVANPSQPGAQFSDITALAPNDIWAVGMDGTNNGMFEHWDGRQWHCVPSPAPSGIGPLSGHLTLNTISAVSATDVWAAGVENPVIPFPNGAVPLFEHWDGHAWSVVPSPSLTGKISSIVALGPDDVWAVGIQNFGIDSGQLGQGLMEHWDGQQWSVIANPTPQRFTQLSGIAHDPTTPGKLWIAGTTGPALSQGDQLSDTQTLIETNQ